ncbi:hypothetical protein ACC848_38360, partial [Rhizobium johnstonii]
TEIPVPGVDIRSALPADQSISVRHGVYSGPQIASQGTVLGGARYRLTNDRQADELTVDARRGLGNSNDPVDRGRSILHRLRSSLIGHDHKRLSLARIKVVLE